VLDLTITIAEPDICQELLDCLVNIKLIVDERPAKGAQTAVNEFFKPQTGAAGAFGAMRQLR
jgi:hypothetical protein